MTNIIVVDDEESIRSLCALELPEEGYEVITTGVCQEVPELIASAQPSAIVLDIRIDDCDGLELLRDIREIHPHLPIILYTAYDSYREHEKSIAADHYVVINPAHKYLTYLLSYAIRRAWKKSMHENSVLMLNSNCVIRSFGFASRGEPLKRSVPLPV